MSEDGHRRPRGPLLRAAAFTGRTLRGEWQGIVVEPLRQLRRRGPFALSLAFLAAFGVIFFHDLAQRPTGALVVWRLGGVTADLPLWLALLRTPVSLYVPALDLPVWAGITQLFLAFALAELALGRARTLAVAYATTLAGTLTVRLMIALGPGWWGLGLPPEAGQVLDTGPSAAVVGLFTYLSVVRRAPVVFTLTGGSMVWESIAVPNLAGREHLIAVAAAIVLGLLHGHRPHWLVPRLPLRRPSGRRGPDGPDAIAGGGAVGAGAAGGDVAAGDRPGAVAGAEAEASGGAVGVSAEGGGGAFADAAACVGGGETRSRAPDGSRASEGARISEGSRASDGSRTSDRSRISDGLRAPDGLCPPDRPRASDGSPTPPPAPESNPSAASAPPPDTDAPPAMSPTSAPPRPASPSAPAASAEAPGPSGSVHDGRCGPILN